MLSAVLLSGNTLFYNASPGEANQLTLSESAGTLTIRDSGAVISPGAGPFTAVSPNEVTLPVAGINSLNVSLGDQNDTLDGSGVTAASGITLGIFAGGDGSDVMIGTQITDSFALFGFQTGSDTIDGQGELPGQRDAIRINSDVDVTVTDNSMQLGTLIGGHSDIEFLSLVGGPANNIIDASGVTAAGNIGVVQINGGDGDDTLIGSELADSVTINGANPGSDTLDLGVAPSGQLDALRVSSDLDVIVTDTILSIGGSSGSHVNLERIAIDGGPSANLIDLSGITASGQILSTQVNAGDGDDTVIGSQLGDLVVISGNSPGTDTLDAQSQGPGQRDSLFVNTDSTITMTDSLLSVGGSSGSHVGFENLSANGGPSPNVIDLSGITATSGFQFVQIDGGAGDDTLTGTQLADRFIHFGAAPGADIIDGQANSGGDDALFAVADTDFELTDSALVVDSVASQYSNLERISVTGGTSGNLLDASATTPLSGLFSVSFNGESGDDTFAPGDLAISYVFNAQDGTDTLDLQHVSVSPNVTLSGPGLIDGTNGNFDSASSFTNVDDIILPPEYDFDSSAYSVTEGDSTNTIIDVQVIRSVNTSIASTVEVELSGLTATVGDDFAAGAITVSFAPGDVSQSVPIVILGDSNVEPDETLSLSFSSGIPGAAATTATLTIENDDAANQPPVFVNAATDATLDDKALPGDSVLLNANFLDPDSGDVHFATVDWGDGTTSNATVDSNSGWIMGSHVYSTGGLFSVIITVTDSLGATDTVNATAFVTGSRLTSTGQLQVIGTSGWDHIHIRGRQGQMLVHAHLGQGPNQFHLWESHPTSQMSDILVLTCDGNDHIVLAPDVHVPATISSGTGRDFVRGGSAGDLIVGGPGRDTLIGRDGNDVLIGGVGKDFLLGGRGQDILIGGWTNHDSDLTALDQILTTWNGTAPFTDRVNQLRDDLLSSQYVHDDHARDRLFGGSNRDWFFASCSGSQQDRLGNFCLVDELSILF